MSTTKVIQLLDSKKWNAANREIARVLESKMMRVIAEARTKVFAESRNDGICPICKKPYDQHEKMHSCCELAEKRGAHHCPICDRPLNRNPMSEATWHQMQAGPVKYQENVWTVEIDPPNQVRSFMTFTNQQQALAYRDNVEAKNPGLRGFVHVRPPTVTEEVNDDNGGNGFYVMGQHTSVGWYLTRAEAEKACTQLNYRGGTNYRVEPADDMKKRGMGASGKFAEDYDSEVPDNDDMDNEPDEEDITTDDHENFYYTGKKIASSPGECKSWMKRHNWYPTVWFISDHGNAHVTTLDEAYGDEDGPPTFVGAHEKKRYDDIRKVPAKNDKGLDEDADKCSTCGADLEGTMRMGDKPVCRDCASAERKAFNDRNKAAGKKLDPRTGRWFKEDTDIQERSCPECGGAGDVKGKECQHCDGQGMVREAYGDSQDAQIWKGILSKMNCPDCKGKGYNDGTKCDRCKGAGEVEREKGYNYKGELKEVFGNLGVHVMQFPSGKWGFVGTLPSNLGTPQRANTADIMAGRTQTGPDGEAYVIKFPVFDSEQAAVNHAKSKGVKVLRDQSSTFKEATDAKCPKCGKTFSQLNDGAIPKHGTIAPNKAGAYRDSKPCPGSGSKVA